VAALNFLQSLAMFAQTPPDAIVVSIVEPEKQSELSRLSDVFIGAVGLTGALVLLAVALGAAMAGVLFWVRSRSA
jgi:hypothetical protein